MLSGCAAAGSIVPEASGAPAVTVSPPPSAAVTVGVSAPPTEVITVPVSAAPAATVTITVSPTPSKHARPRISYLRVAQRPKCAEGTAVFRAEPVPLVLEWKITGATGGALSVDDPSGTPGTYGPVDLEGSMEFSFACTGEVGTTEKHTYALYTVGGGPVRSMTVTASATVLDKGPGTE